MAEVVISGIKRLSEIESAAQQSDQSEKIVPSQLDIASVSSQEVLIQRSPAGQFLLSSPYPSSGSDQINPMQRHANLFGVTTRMERPLPAQIQSAHQAEQISSVSQLKTLLQAPLTGLPRAAGSQSVEMPVLPVSQVVQFQRPHQMISEEPQPSTSTVHQQLTLQQQCSSPLERATPSPSSVSLGYPVFSQSQFTSHLRMMSSSSHSSRSSPVDPTVHSSTQFLPPQVQQRSPGRPRVWGDKREYNCLECGKVFKSQQALGYHRNAKHGHREDLMCPLCGKMLSHKQHKNYHMKHTHGIEDYDMMSL